MLENDFCGCDFIFSKLTNIIYYSVRQGQIINIIIINVDDLN